VPSTDVHKHRMLLHMRQTCSNAFTIKTGHYILEIVLFA